MNEIDSIESNFVDAPNFKLSNYPLDYKDNGLGGSSYDDFWTEEFVNVDENIKQTGYKVFDLNLSTPDDLRDIYKIGIEAYFKKSSL